MAKERLSRLQKWILLLLYGKGKELHGDGEYERFGVCYQEVLCGAAKKFNRSRIEPVRGGTRLFIDESFMSVFSQSIRNLGKKGLIEAICKHEFYEKCEANKKPIVDRERVKVFGIWITKGGIEKVESLNLK